MHVRLSLWCCVIAAGISSFVSRGSAEESWSEPIVLWPAGAASCIVVDFGPHPSAEAAGHGEAGVDWLDADPTDDTVCTQCFAALELQHYLRKLTGRPEDFPIVDDDPWENETGPIFRSGPEGASHRADPSSSDVVLVGGPASNAAARTMAPTLGVNPDRLAELGPEGYLIKSAAVDGRRVTLVAGGGRVGTLYGAYDLLYQLGCRWFAPGEVHEEIPHAEQIPDLTREERPSFRTRGFLAWEDRGNPDFLVWMARNRLNEWCVEQSEHAMMRKLGIGMVCGLHDAESLFLHPDAAYPYDHPFFTGDEGKPVDPYPAGDQCQGDANADGKLTYFEAHPEWFAYENGRRIPGNRGWGGTNYCTSNAHASAEFMKNYVQALVDGPYQDADRVRFWTLDAARWCQCDECKALGAPTDRNLLLVHRLDQEIKKAQADGRIHRPIAIRFLAYADVLAPPTRPLPAGFDGANCTATFYPIVRCYVHNFDDPDCPRNAEYQKQLDGWATDPDRHYRGRLCIGEYYNVSGYKCLPVCFMHTMASDLPHFYKVGARQFQYMHVTTDHWGTKALSNFQMARQLWNIETDCEALWSDYFTRRYGPAAGTMRSFYESLEGMLSNVSELKYGLARRLDRGVEDLFPTPHLRYRRVEGEECDGPTLVEIVEHGKTCRALVDEALAMDLPGRIRGRIAEDEQTFTYAERTIAYFHECVEAFQLGRSGRRDEAREHFAEAQRLAELLRADVTSATKSSSHANAANAFEATLATGAIACLAKLLGPPVVKRFDPAEQPLVIAGSEFFGGGAMRYGDSRGGNFLYIGRQETPVTTRGNHVYAASTGEYSRIAVTVRFDEPPSGRLSLTLFGLRYTAPGEKDVPMEVLVAGKPVYEGPAPFTDDALTGHEIAIPAGLIGGGDNEIVLRNTAPQGPIGNRPWFGIARVELRVEAQTNLD